MYKFKHTNEPPQVWPTFLERKTIKGIIFYYKVEKPRTNMMKRCVSYSAAIPCLNLQSMVIFHCAVLRLSSGAVWLDMLDYWHVNRW